MHQDICSLELDFCEKVEKYLLEYSQNIVGVAGVPKYCTTVSDIYETKNRIKRSIPTDGKLVEVDSLDECLFAMTREKWAKKV